MPPDTEERFGLCSEAEKVPHEFEKRAVGADDRYGEVTVLRCARCGRLTTTYYVPTLGAEASVTAETAAYCDECYAAAIA